VSESELHTVFVVFIVYFVDVLYFFHTAQFEV